MRRFLVCEWLDCFAEFLQVLSCDHRYERKPVARELRRLDVRDACIVHRALARVTVKLVDLPEASS